LSLICRLVVFIFSPDLTLQMCYVTENRNWK
jgi:hypothetical protein